MDIEKSTKHHLTKKKEESTIRSSAAEYLTYVASVGDQQDSIEMRYEEENIWLTQKMMATLYDVGTNTINYHIKKIFEDSELQEDSVIRKFRITALDGKSYRPVGVIWQACCFFISLIYAHASSSFGIWMPVSSCCSHRNHSPVDGLFRSFSGRGLSAPLQAT